MSAFSFSTIKFSLTAVYTGCMTALFLFFGVLFSDIAVGQNLTASLDAKSNSAANSESGGMKVYSASPPQSYRSQARQFIKKGAYSEAMEMYQKELLLHPDNTFLIQEYEALQKTMRQLYELGQTEDANQQRRLALSLCNYLRENQVNRDYLVIALFIYEKSKDQSDVSRVLDAYSRLDRYGDAIYFLDTLDIPEDIVKMYKVSIYLAAEEISYARSLVRTVQVKQLCNPEELMMLSRLQAATGLQASSVKTLVKCFESSPEQMLVSLKRQASKFEEFDDIRGSAEFKAAMKTQSLANTADFTPPCARKWISVKVDETPTYIRNFKSKEINFNEWHVK